MGIAKLTSEQPTSPLRMKSTITGITNLTRESSVVVSDSESEDNDCTVPTAFSCLSAGRKRSHPSFKKPRRAVSFVLEATAIPSASPLDESEGGYGNCASMWYRPADLDQMRSEARELCRSMRAADGAVAGAAPGRTVKMAADEPSRGLESRCCLERQRRKFIASKCIVQAQHKLTPDRLAELAGRCTSWAAEVAAVEAERDYARAYQSDDARCAVTKRAYEEDGCGGDDRRVRARLV